MLRQAYGVMPVATGPSSTMRDRALLRGVAQPQVQDGQLLFEIGAEQHDGRGRGGLVDRRPRQVEEGGRQAVARLGVAVRRADGVGQAGPRVGVLVGAAGAAEHGDAARAAGRQRVLHELGGGAHRHTP